MKCPKCGENLDLMRGDECSLADNYVPATGRPDGAGGGEAAIRGAMARLCRAVSRRMMPDEPTPEDRIEMLEAYAAACALLESCQPNDKLCREQGGKDSDGR